MLTHRLDCSSPLILIELIGLFCPLKNSRLRFCKLLLYQQAIYFDAYDKDSLSSDSSPDSLSPK